MQQRDKVAMGRGCGPHGPEACYTPDIVGEVDERLGFTEPTEAGYAAGYRAGSQRGLAVLAAILRHLHDAKDFHAAFWEAAYAIGDPICGGVPIADRAYERQMTKAALSKGALKLCDTMGIQPSGYLLSEMARETFKQTNGRRNERNTNDRA